MHHKSKGTFRDPAGSVVIEEGRVVRRLADEELLEVLESSEVVREEIGAGHLVAYKALEKNVMEHPKIGFVSFPFEWSPTMLFDAGKLTMELGAALLGEGLGLKDATPFNVLFDGSRPVFVDIASVERRNPLDQVWRPYGQFHQMFLMPLFLHRSLGMSMREIFLSHLNGVPVEACVKRVKRTSLKAYTLVLLPQWLSKFTNAKTYGEREAKSEEFASFVLKRVLKKGLKDLKKVRPKGKKSHWGTYMDKHLNYTRQHFDAKVAWVDECLEKVAPQRVLDVGCNTGTFSMMGAKRGASVVAIDSDPFVIDEVYKKAKTAKANVLPLVVNLSQPTPSMGWRNREWPSFLERSQGHFDLVMMLAVIHHMLVTDRIPMGEIAELCSELATGWLIVEFVHREDAMFQQLVRGRDELYEHIDLELFKREFGEFFEVIEETDGSYHPTRTLLLLRKVRA